MKKSPAKLLRDEIQRSINLNELVRTNPNSMDDAAICLFNFTKRRMAFHCEMCTLVGGRQIVLEKVQKLAEAEKFITRFVNSGAQLEISCP